MQNNSFYVQFIQWYFLYFKLVFPLYCLQLSLTVKKQVIFWITVPCIDNVGSCTYDDLCNIMTQFGCPAPFKEYGIPCRCPFAKVS